MDESYQIYGLEGQARALCSLQAESEAVKFFAATQSLKPDSDQIHQIEVLEKPGKYKAHNFYHNLGEVWRLSASPFNQNVLASVFSTFQNSQISMGAAILTIPEDLDRENPVLAHEIVTIQETEIKTAEFSPSDPKTLAVVLESGLEIRDLETSKAVSEVPSSAKLTGGRWNFNGNQFICLQDCSVRGFDVRDSRSQVWTIEGAHGQQSIRDIDCNRLQQGHFVTGGDDNSIRVWDIRSPKEAVFSRTDHNHWVFSVRYNTFHDSLILSGSSDTKVILTCARSVSSEMADETKNKLQDGLLQVFEHHEESVYAVDWSSADPWIFASLSYDGRVVISQVEKQRYL